MKHRFFALALSIALVGCGRDGPSAQDEKAIVDAVGVQLDGMSYQYKQTWHSCRTLFDRGEPVIKDTQVAGSTGKLRLEVPITALDAIDRTEWFSPRFIYFSDPCYGAPQSGWTKGKTSPSRYNVEIEKWDSGWRLVPGQQLVPTG